MSIKGSSLSPLSRAYTTTNSNHDTPISLLEYLRQTIRVKGPMPFADYMKEALTNPRWGYYMKQEQKVFGERGDYTTSPEISQVFGELVGVWYLNQWMQLGQPDFQFVELGPGRGTLMADIIRVFNKFKTTQGSFQIVFVEKSIAMRGRQADTMRVVSQIAEDAGTTEDGLGIKWFSYVQDVPKDITTFYLAHEFFDALPVHLFRKIDGNWCELLVSSQSEDEGLEYVSAPGQSPLEAIFIPSTSSSTECEISPEAAVIFTEISRNIQQNGGCGLIIDYGSEEQPPDGFSIRGFRNHTLIDDVLSDPGNCDITANVDYGFLKRFASEGVSCYGPVTQQSFLSQMGIGQRLQTLLQNATEEQREQLISAATYLLAPEQMGDKFKVMAVTRTGDPTPAAFQL